jgi:hypothetical protein
MSNLRYLGIDHALRNEHLVLRAVQSKKKVAASLTEKLLEDGEFLKFVSLPNLRTALTTMGWEYVQEKSAETRETTPVLGIKDNIERWIEKNGVLRAYCTEGTVFAEAANVYGLEKVSAQGSDFGDAYEALERKLRLYVATTSSISREVNDAEFNLLQQMRIKSQL